MHRPSTVEFYHPDGTLAVRVKTEIVPPEGGLIIIRGHLWRVDAVTYCVDHADDFRQRIMRANVDLVEANDG